MFTIETIKLSPNAVAYSRESKTQSYTNMTVAEQHAYNLIESQNNGDYRKIGSGCFAEVYGMRKSPIVYKIGDAVKNVGYMAYITELSKQTATNPYMPKIHAVRVYQRGRNDKWFVVAMERLNEGSSTAFYNACTMLRDIIEHNKFDNNLLSIKLPKPLENGITIIREAYRKTSHTDCGLDLHNGNFMVRGKNQLVITDPLA